MKEKPAAALTGAPLQLYSCKKRESAPDRAALLRRVNILALPRANPDGAALFKRSTAQDDIDMNRDHLLLRTPEARAMAQNFSAGDPNVNLQDVMVNLQKASMSFQQMVQVRNRLVTAYQDIMNMPV